MTSWVRRFSFGGLIGLDIGNLSVNDRYTMLYERHRRYGETESDRDGAREMMCGRKVGWVNTNVGIFNHRVIHAQARPSCLWAWNGES